MILWLEIDSDPPVALYRERAALEHIDIDTALPLLSSVGTLHRPLSVPGLSPGENANVRVTLDNAGGDITALFAHAPPLRVPARLVSSDAIVFEGVITDCELGASAGLNIEAGLLRPLSDTVPLRTTVVWGGYKNVRVIPQCYGVATVEPIPYDREGRLFVVADHASAGVDRVTRDDAPTDAWAWRNTVDSTGTAVTLLELAMPLSEGERLAVTLRGRMHPATGALLTTPADVLWDLLANVCGLPVTLSRMDTFRASTADLTIGGIIDDAAATIRATVDQLLGSVGAAWSAGAPEVAMLWPWPDDGSTPTLAEYDRLTARDVTPSARHSGLVTVLRVLYDYDHAVGRHRRAMQLEAPDAIKQYGRIESEWDARWLRSPRRVEALGRRLLGWLARPRWHVTWRAASADIPPGGWVTLDHPHSPLNGRHRLLDAELDLARAGMTLAIEAPVGAEPEIETTALSTAFEPMVANGASVVYQNGVATITVQDDTGRPLGGAHITLDGTTTRIADPGGRVQFEAGRGKHLLYIEATGYQPMEVEITL